MTLWDDDPAPDPLEATFSVMELGIAIREVLAGAFPRQIWVRGEIRNLKKPGANGHCYFDLVEPGAAPGERPDARMPVTLFNKARQRVNATLLDSGTNTRMVDGIEIRAQAELDWWIGGGRLQLVMTAIDPVFTLGRLAEQRARLLAALRAEDLLDRNGRVPVPPVPLRVALVTSRGSAAEADFLHELDASAFRFTVLVLDARVQGPEAVDSVRGALAAAADLPVDVVALVRGGGATTDLLAFDSEPVARAIAACPLPVLTGIGHEIDRTVADEVAHTAAKTPTACAAGLVARVAAADQALDAVWDAVGRRGRRAVDRAAQRAALAAHQLPRLAAAATVRPSAAVDARSARLRREATRLVTTHGRALDERTSVLRREPGRLLRRAEERLGSAEATLRALDPARVLARGWSITHDAAGTLVRDPAQVAPGDTLVTTLAAGRVASVVTDTATDAPPS